MSDEVVKTGIKGLDEVLGGGFIPKASILVSGGPGSGKSIFGLQFIIEGARQYGEAGVYVTVEETADDIRFYGKRLGWNIADFEAKNLVTIIEQPVQEGSLISIDYIVRIVREKNAKRVVLDSLTLFNYMYGQQTTTLKTEILRFIKAMSSFGVTLVVISERHSTGIDDITFTSEDFIFTGIILLLKLRIQASYERCLSVIKMRGVNHSLRVHPFKISPGGILVLTDAKPFALTGAEDGGQSG